MAAELRNRRRLTDGYSDEDSEEVEELDTTLPEYSGEPELEEELVEEP